MNTFHINSLPLLLSLSAMFGILLHDTKIDSATALAMTVPVALASYGAADVAFKMSDPHTHSERSGFSQSIRELRTQQPRLQTRFGDDERHVVAKKSSVTISGGEYSWPSI